MGKIEKEKLNHMTKEKLKSVAPFDGRSIKVRHPTTDRPHATTRRHTGLKAWSRINGRNAWPPSTHDKCPSLAPAALAPIRKPCPSASMRCGSAGMMASIGLPIATIASPITKMSALTPIASLKRMRWRVTVSRMANWSGFSISATWTCLHRSVKVPRPWLWPWMRTRVMRRTPVN